ncbi:MAG: cytochrome c peroxidase [Candidatus Competibacteraceae bacterium]|nr:cytochrome c peroxidase [Candidatus Competibacteraceae bacterium]
MSRRLPLLSLALLTMAATVAIAQPIPTPEQVRQAIGHLGPVLVPESNPLTPAKVELGEKLFNDNRLSGDGSLSCRNCHLPDHGFAVPAQVGPAYPSQSERRNSPTLINVAYNLPLIWDGRAGSLDKQALGPIQNILHQNNNLDLLAERLKTDPDYVDLFTRAYGDQTVTAERIGNALSSYERTLVFDDSPLDRYMDGDTTALHESQQRGLALFMGKANCIACHRGPNLTDNAFHNLGVPDEHIVDDPAILASIRFDAKRTGLENWASLEEDPGREQISHDPADRGKFRTMGLRNIEQSSPYMHNGALATLEEVVAFYNRGGGQHPNRSPLMKPLELSEQDMQDLVAFMKALTGVQRQMPSR